MAIDWTRGYSCEWHAYEVVLDTWADGDELSSVETAKVERSYEGDAPLIESGEIHLTAPIGVDWDERYLRLVMKANQDGERERVDVCTLLCQAVSGEVNRGIDAIRVTGRSVLYPASIACMDIGAYAPAGSDGVDLAAKMLRDVIAAPVETVGSFTLASHVVYDLGASVLSVVWDILSAGNYGIRIAGDGTVQLAPMDSAPSLLLDKSNMRLLHEGMPYELDWSGVPNRYVAVDGAEIAEAVNDDPNSVTSTVYRGYRYDVIDTAPTRIGGETLTTYCARRLEEESVAYDVRNWSREWWPEVVPGDIIRVALSSNGAEGDFRVQRQSLDCGHGIVVEEQARREVHSWTRT